MYRRHYVTTGGLYEVKSIDPVAAPELSDALQAVLFVTDTTYDEIRDAIAVQVGAAPDSLTQAIARADELETTVPTAPALEDYTAEIALVGTYPIV